MLVHSGEYWYIVVRLVYSGEILVYSGKIKVQNGKTVLCSDEIYWYMLIVSSYIQSYVQKISVIFTVTLILRGSNETKQKRAQNEAQFDSRFKLVSENCLLIYV